MIVVTVIGTITAIAVPSFQKARVKSQVTTCMNNMRKIEAAKQQWAFTNTGTPSWTDLEDYLRVSPPLCPAGGEYKMLEIRTGIYCTIHDWRKQGDDSEAPAYEELRGFHP